MSPKHLLIASAVALGSCDVFEADHETVRGAVFFFNTAPAVFIPDSVIAGVPFTVTVRTFGDGCYSFARTEIDTEDRTTEIRPFDFRKTEDPCPDILLTIDHSVTLLIGSQGAHTVRVEGLRLPGGTTEKIQKAVVVRERP